MQANDPKFLEFYARPGLLIRRAHQIATSIFVETFRELDLTPAQYGVLAIFEYVETIDQSSLARMLGHDKSTLGVIAANLENRGLIRRSRNAVDRRLIQLELTEAGGQLLERATPLLPPVRAALLEPFTKQESIEFVRLLIKFHSTFNEKVKTSIRADMPY